MKNKKYLLSALFLSSAMAYIIDNTDAMYLATAPSIKSTNNFGGTLLDLGATGNTTLDLTQKNRMEESEARASGTDIFEMNPKGTAYSGNNTVTAGKTSGRNIGGISFGTQGSRFTPSMASHAGLSGHNVLSQGIGTQSGSIMADSNMSLGGSELSETDQSTALAKGNHITGAYDGSHVDDSQNAMMDSQYTGGSSNSTVRSSD